MSMVDEMVAGAVGGLAGGLIMTGVMTAGKKSGMIAEPLPVKVEHWVEDQAGVTERPSPQAEMAIAQGGHLVYSAALGAGYGMLRSALGTDAIPSGPLYGLGIYALNVGGIGPALNITKEPWNQEPMATGRQMMMHVVFGLVTGVVSEQVREMLDSH